MYLYVYKKLNNSNISTGHRPSNTNMSINTMLSKPMDLYTIVILCSVNIYNTELCVYI